MPGEKYLSPREKANLDFDNLILTCLVGYPTDMCNNCDEKVDLNGLNYSSTRLKSHRKLIIVMNRM